MRASVISSDRLVEERASGMSNLASDGAVVRSTVWIGRPPNGRSTVRRYRFGLLESPSLESSVS